MHLLDAARREGGRREEKEEERGSKPHQIFARTAAGRTIGSPSVAP